MNSRTSVPPVKVGDKLQQVLVRRNCWMDEIRNSTTRESSAAVDEDDVDLEISRFWLHEARFHKMYRERRSLNLNNVIYRFRPA